MTGIISTTRACHALASLVRTADDETMAERLFREARAAAGAAHPAVVTVYAHGTDPDTGYGYLVMEHLVGEDLQVRLARVGALPLSLALRIGVEACVIG